MICFDSFSMLVQTCLDHQSQGRSLPQFLNNHIMEFGREDFDGLIVSRGMDPVREKDDFQITNGVDPDTRAGKPQLAERL